MELPPTHWSWLLAIRRPSAEKEAALTSLVEAYGLPVYLFIRQKGFDHWEAEDLAQGFFAKHLVSEGAFHRADPARGRFRNFLLTCLCNYLADHAKKKDQGPHVEIVSSIEKVVKAHSSVLRQRSEAPESVFRRAWFRGVLERALSAYERECREKGNQIHFELLRDCIIRPCLDDAPRPAREELARRYNLTEKQVSNRLLAARHAYQRLIRAELMRYTSSAAELRSEERALSSVIKYLDDLKAGPGG